MLTRILLATAAISAPIALAAPAHAQKLPAPVVAVVDVDRILSECNACKTAQNELNGQLTSLRQLAQQLGQPLQAEAQSLDAALKAANGKPDAALLQRRDTFIGRQQDAQRQVEEQEQTFQRNVQYVRYQVLQALGPIVTQISQQRGATVTLEKGQVLYAAPTMEITDQVLASLNQSLTTVGTVAPPPQQAAGQPAQQQPPGR